MTHPDTNADEINICGVLVHVQPLQSTQVEQDLLAIPGVEVHAVTDEGKMVVTIEENYHRASEILNKLPLMDGVLSAAMIYQHHETETTEYG